MIELIVREKRKELSAVKTLVIGVGNPIMGDDRVGIEVARRLRGELEERSDIEVREIAAGGLPLVEEFVGYDKVIVIDALVGAEPGEVVVKRPEGRGGQQGSAGVHGVDFESSLRILRSVY